MPRNQTLEKTVIPPANKATRPRGKFITENKSMEQVPQYWLRAFILCSGVQRPSSTGLPL